MSLKSVILCAGVSTLALSGAAFAQDAASSEEVVVTGSRVVTGNQAPTPVTAVTAEKLLEATPTNVPDALKTLPQFAGAQGGQRTAGLGGADSTANTLNLRNFGPQRLLILLDGNRVQPSSTAGTVNLDTMPEMLLERVDIVTGGASAVYGSDAVSGVVNYVIDKDFTGLKTIAQYGISSRSDNQTWKLGFAAGANIFGDRGHIEGSYVHYQSDGIAHVWDREEGEDNWTQSGAGSAANPIRLVRDARYFTTGRGGYIPNATLTGIPQPVPAIRDFSFREDGQAFRTIHGTPTGSGGLEGGGPDGTWVNARMPLAPLQTDQYFTRFDYDLTSDVQAYVMINYNESQSRSPAIAPFILDTFGRILNGNPFIPANLQTAINTAGIPVGGIAFYMNRMEDIRDHENDGITPITAAAKTGSFFGSVGLAGSIGDRFDWNAQYNNGRTVTRVTNEGNLNAEKLSAALDVVTDPNTGRPVCNVLLTSFAWRFPGCEPLNVFGPTAPSKTAYDWLRDDTTFALVNTMDDFTASIGGDIVTLPAGPVRAVVNAEYRQQTLVNHSSVQPTRPLDCRGLRANCAEPGITPYTQSITANIDAEGTVAEAGAEMVVPLLADMTMFKNLDLTGAFRYAEYESSASTTAGAKADFVATTWKIGASWAINEELRLRASRSRDIRAPNLFDLFSPTSVSPSGLQDLHTGITAAPFTYSQGNPNLVPEVAKVITAGFVYQPAWLPNFSIAVDYYNLDMQNAITQANGGNLTLQRECEASNGTSPYCALLERPLPFSDRSPANFPTRIFSQGVNAAKQKTEGFDVEANYRFDAAVLAGAPGTIALRGLVSYQPTFKTQTVINGPVSQSAGVGSVSKVRTVLNASYDLENLSVSLQQRWQSENHPFDPALTFYDMPEFDAKAYTDMTVSYRMEVGGNEFRPFVTVQNMFDTSPPIAGSAAISPGLVYPAAAGYDIVGRYITVGLRANF